jgi:hypothetical protein
MEWSGGLALDVRSDCHPSLLFLTDVLCSGKSPLVRIYAGICALGFIYLVFCLPGTKGKSLEAIEQPWG